MTIIEAVRKMREGSQPGCRQLALDDVLKLLEADPILRTAPFERLQVLTNTLHQALMDQFEQRDTLPEWSDAIRQVIHQHVLNAAALHQRVFDLLRQMRSTLHQEHLISREEYAWLSAEAAYWEGGDPETPGQGSQAPRRLESYDDHQNRMKVMAVRIGRAVVTCRTCGLHPDKPPCGQCRQLKAVLRDYLKTDAPMEDHVTRLRGLATDWEAEARKAHSPVIEARASGQAAAFKAAADILEGRT